MPTAAASSRRRFFLFFPPDSPAAPSGDIPLGLLLLGLAAAAPLYPGFCACQTPVTSSDSNREPCRS